MVWIPVPRQTVLSWSSLMMSNCRRNRFMARILQSLVRPTAQSFYCSVYYFTSSSSSNTTLSLIASHVFRFFFSPSQLPSLVLQWTRGASFQASLSITEPLKAACVCVCVCATCRLFPKHTNKHSFTLILDSWEMLTESKWRMSSKNEGEWRVKIQTVDKWTEVLIREEQHRLRFEEKPSEDWRS